MKNMGARLDHWSDGHTAINQGDSPPCPFEKYTHFFTFRDVLEIGAGEGRQYEYAHIGTKSYSIADISEEALDTERIPLHVDRYLITDYDSNFGRKFDLIHFWYVLHHIPREELFAFINFLRRHLISGGILMFNTPYLDFDEGAYADDGVNTTPHKIYHMLQYLDPYFFCLYVDGTKWGKSNGHIYVGSKK